MRKKKPLSIDIINLANRNSVKICKIEILGKFRICFKAHNTFQVITFLAKMFLLDFRSLNLKTKLSSEASEKSYELF